jgi:hypothetical protein
VPKTGEPIAVSVKMGPPKEMLGAIKEAVDELAVARGS